MAVIDKSASYTFQDFTAKSTPAVGLSGNTIYGATDLSVNTDDLSLGRDHRYTMLDNPRLLNATVPATTFTTKCGLLPSAKQLASSVNTSSQSWTFYTPVHNATNFTIGPMHPWTLRIAHYDFETYTPESSTADIVIYGHLNVTDAEGQNGTTITLNPPVNNGVLGIQDSVYSQLQIMGCSMGVSYHSAVINGSTGIMQTSSIDDDRSLPPTWQNWQPAAQDINVSYTWPLLMDSNLRVPQSPVTECLNNDQPCGGMSNEFFNVAEWFINIQLGLWHTLSDGSTNPPMVPISVTLRDLEMALENATAIVYWANSRLEGGIGWDDNATVLVTVSQLVINVLPVIVALAASFISLAMLCGIIPWRLLLSRSTSNVSLHSGGISSVGVLEVIWMFGRDPRTIKTVALVEQPTIHNLRKAGMLQINKQDGHMTEEMQMESEGHRLL